MHCKGSNLDPAATLQLVTCGLTNYSYNPFQLTWNIAGKRRNSKSYYRLTTLIGPNFLKIISLIATCCYTTKNVLLILVE